MKNIVQGVIIALFALVMVAGVYFAMSVEGPGLPPPSAQSEYMIKDDGRSVSCFFPLLGACKQKPDDLQPKPVQQ
jgi:hypothetical protein